MTIKRQSNHCKYLQFPPVSGDTLRDAHLYTLSKEDLPLQVELPLAGSFDYVDHPEAYSMIPSQRSSE
jgi:hypothetical protein